MAPRRRGIGARPVSSVSSGRNAEPGAPGYFPPIAKAGSGAPSPVAGKTRGVAKKVYITGPRRDARSRPVMNMPPPITWTANTVSKRTRKPKRAT